jgi:hypothetical protein
VQVRNHPKEGFFVPGLTAVACTCYAEVEKESDVGNKARTIGATAMNATSSRAHTIFTLGVTAKDPVKGTELNSKIDLIDLAGSESAGKTNASGSRLKEGANINKSLVTLGTVIRSLADGGGRAPFRDSKLTLLLARSLGGNSKAIRVAAISPALDNFQESMSTLRYADQVKKIKNTVVKNEAITPELVKALRAEIAKLQAGGGAAAAPADGGGGGGGPDRTAEIDELNEHLKFLEADDAELQKRKGELENSRNEATADMAISIQEIG